MRKRNVLTLLAFGLFFVAAAVAFLLMGCGDKGPSSPTAVPASSSSSTGASAATNPQPPANPPTGGDETDRPQLKFTPSGVGNDDPFGSGYSCADYPVGTEPVWRGAKSRWTVVEVTNTTSTSVKWTHQVFGEKEPGCVATTGGRKGGNDIVILEQPGWIPPGGVGIARWRIDLEAAYGDYYCGRFQVAVGIKFADDREWWNVRDRMIDTGRGPDECDKPPEECPANAYASIDAMFVPQQTTTACPPWVPVSWSVDSNLATTQVTLPIPPMTQTGPNTGTLPVRDETYSVTFKVDGFDADGRKCGHGEDTLQVRGCGCEPCETETSVTLTNELVEDAQQDAYRVRTSFVMNPPGKYHLVVSQGATVLRDVTSSIQQAYLSPGNAETPLPCGSGPVDVTFEVLDDKCGEDVVCKTVEKSIRIPQCEQTCDDWRKQTSVQPHAHPNGMYAGNWVIDTNMAGNFSDTEGNGHAFGTGHDEADYEYPVTGTAYGVTGTWTVQVGDERCRTSETMRVPWCVQPEPPQCECGVPRWNEQDCVWQCPECECEEEIPPEGPAQVNQGPPRTECGTFGFDTGTPADFWIVKCGQFYEIHHQQYGGAQCQWQPEPQDVSHQTPCKCPEPE